MADKKGTFNAIALKNVTDSAQFATPQAAPVTLATINRVTQAWIAQDKKESK